MKIENIVKNLLLNINYINDFQELFKQHSKVVNRALSLIILLHLYCLISYKSDKNVNNCFIY